MDLPDYDPKSIGRRLEELMAEQGLTQHSVAEAVGMTQARISQMVNGVGDKHIRLVNLDKVVRLLNTTPNYLMYGLEPRYRT